MQLTLPGIALMLIAAGPADSQPKLLPRVADYVAAREAEFDQIPAARKEQLRELSAYVRTAVAADRPVRLTFICTHNSRRSHMAQLWAAVAATRYGTPRITTYSGGTEATAFNPRAVAAIARAGLSPEPATDDANAVYLVHYASGRPPVVAFSKVHDQPPNPTTDFCAVMVCSDADEKCPQVRGAAARIAIPYADPKAADGTKQEAAVYDERCRQIAREMLFAFAEVRAGKTQ